MLQGLTETDDSFRTRLKASYKFGATSGTALGILLQLQYQGYDVTTDGYLIQQNGLVSSLSGVPTDFDNLQSLLTTTTAEPNDLISGSPPYFAIPIRTQSYPIPNALFNYNLPNHFGVQQNNRFILFFNTVPSIWSGGIPSTNQLQAIQSIINTWKNSSTLFCGVIINNGASISNWNSICGSAICGAGAVNVYISSDYLPITPP